MACAGSRPCSTPSINNCILNGAHRLYDVSSDFREVQPLTRIVPPLILLSPTTNHIIVQVARSEARVDVRLLDCACIAPDQVFCSPLRVLLHSLRLTSRTLQFVVLGEQGWLAVYDFR